MKPLTITIVLVGMVSTLVSCNLKVSEDVKTTPIGYENFESLAVDRPYKMDWLPKSHTLLFNTFSHVQTGVYKPSYDFHWIDVDTGTLKTIAHAGKGGNFYPSPDGKTIILVSPESLTMTDINGNHQRTLLTYPHYPVSGEFNFLPAVEPIWAEDSKSFVIAIPELNFSELSPIAVTRFWHVSTVTQSSELMAQVDLDSFSSPVISPDLTRVIYQKAPSDNHEENKLYLAQIDFSDETLIDIHKDQLPYLISWSPDSKHYVMIFASTGTLLGNNEGKTELIDEDNLRGIQKYRWLDLTRFLTINEQNELRLGIIGAPTSILITTLGDNYDVFDFVY